MFTCNFSSHLCLTITFFCFRFHPLHKCLLQLVSSVIKSVLLLPFFMIFSLSTFQYVYFTPEDMLLARKCVSEKKQEKAKPTYFSYFKSNFCVIINFFLFCNWVKTIVNIIGKAQTKVHKILLSHYISFFGCLVGGAVVLYSRVQKYNMRVQLQQDTQAKCYFSCAVLIVFLLFFSPCLQVRSLCTHAFFMHNALHHHHRVTVTHSFPFRKLQDTRLVNLKKLEYKYWQQQYTFSLSLSR